MGVGYLVADLESRTVGDKVVANGTIAIKRKYSVEDKSDFINISIWGRGGETAIKYTKKGDLLAISGELQIERKNDQYYTRVNVEDFKFFNRASTIDKPAKLETKKDDDFEFDFSSLKDDNDLPF